MRMPWTRRRCRSCGAATPAWSDVCGRCGRGARSRRWRRAAAVLSLVLGALLAGGAAYLIVLIASIVARSDDPGAATRFTGTGWQLALVYGVLGYVLLHGALAIFMGVWRLRGGRRSPRLMRVVTVFYVIFWVGAMLVQLFSLLG